MWYDLREMWTCHSVNMYLAHLWTCITKPTKSRWAQLLICYLQKEEIRVSMGDFEVWYYYVEERSFYVILQIGSINCMISTCFCCFSRPICFQSDISCNHSMCPFRGEVCATAKWKMGGSRTSLRVKMEVYRTSLRVKMEVYRTNWLLWNWLCRDKGVSWTRFFVINAHALPM